MSKKVCDYGCGQEALYQFKNGKWCCSKSWNACPALINSRRSKLLNRTWNDIYGVEEATKRKQQRSELYKKKNPMQGRKHTKESKDLIRNIKLMQNTSEIVKKSYTTSLRNIRRKKAYALWNDPDFRKKCTYSIKKSWKKQEIKNKHKRTIEYLNKQYLFFSKIEEMRYNPDKTGEKEIQVHCKNHECKNSKENGGWFTPTGRQIEWRIAALENRGCDNNYFYCSQHCKDICSLYNLRKDPYKNENDILYTQLEHNVWRSTVFEQDNNECQYCGSKENLHCHHIKPVKTHPQLALDPDNGITLCKKCHYEIGHKTGTECSTGNLANKQQNGCRLGNKINNI